MTELERIEQRKFDGALGTKCTESGTTFRLWQPLAERVELCLYDSRGVEIRRCKMRSKNGVFECRIRGDLDGVRYTFLVTRGSEIVESPDIYSKSVTADGRFSIAVDMRRHAPKNWAYDRAVSLPDPENAVICELSVRDFSMDENASFKNRGKFAAFCEKKVTNIYGAAAGLSYIKKLGVTHIQLMPVFDFDMGGGEYNWGYNPRFYNAPSAYYSREDGVLELRRLVETVHKQGLGLVADVVYNHVFDAERSAFERQLPGYYFRTDENAGFSNGSGCGNEFASERVMARKLIVDSLVFLAREYHLDGFRFDLMGLLDIETLRAAESKLRAINPDILLYGEGWTGGASALCEEKRAVLANARELHNFAFFNDSFRDGVKGSVFDAKDCGFVNGAADEWHFAPIKAALSGAFPEDFWTDDPRQLVNYVECHDNLTLFDKLRLSLEDSDSDRVRLADKAAAAFTFLSRGMAFIQAGQEFLRSKNGDANSYNKPDSVNAIRWNGVSENSALVEYYRGLIAIRKRFRGELGERAFTDLGGCLMMTAGDFVLLYNTTEQPFSPDIVGVFKVYADKYSASDKPLYFAKRLYCAENSILLARRA